MKKDNAVIRGKWKDGKLVAPAIAVFAVSFFLYSAEPVHAGRVARKASRGAAAGALVGGIVDGSDGAVTGAVVGGSIDAISGAADRHHRNHHYRRHDRRRHDHHGRHRRR